MTALLAGLAFGAFGSGHCALMCGPLAMLSRSTGSALGYHCGRMATYLMLGLAAGFLGASAASAGAGRALALFAGVWLILLSTGRLDAARHFGRGARAVTAALARIGCAARERRGSSFVFGALNGLLPCGLVYAAVIGASGFGSIGAGLWFLLGFGAGTIPALAAAGALRPAFSRLPFDVRKGASIALATVGLLLIVRGTMAGPTSVTATVPTQHDHFSRAH